MKLLKGIHYSNEFIYNLLTFLKLGTEYNERYRIAASYLNEGESVLDLCSGTGKLREFIPQKCKYEAIEPSFEFNRILKNRNIKCYPLNLHLGIDAGTFKPDTLVMLISLCHFRETSIDVLLESFKNIAKRVIIVEDVLPRRRTKKHFLQRLMNYLCSTQYYVPIELFTREEFSKVMGSHGYKVNKHTERYYVGSFSN